MRLKYKLTGVIAALALTVGAVPVAVAAADIETGQMLDKGPRWPHKSIHYVTLAVGVAAAFAAILLLTSNDDRPVSP